MRAAYIAGFTGTATLAAERDFGVPAFGTMAHSFVQAHDTEAAAFRNFAAAWPDNVILLIDTYDTLAAARHMAEVARDLAKHGIVVRGVRLDSGDLIALAKQVRQIFDGSGLGQLQLFASSSVDEYFIAKAVAEGAPIDGYGIGTHLRPLPTSPIWIAPTSFRNMPASRGASARSARRPGRDANRSIAS